ncbi:DUF6146 family protein [Flavobacterium sp.]|uniref:DUF6146 family protein n=1 Tax=Flavobacterium sp. TaxID=239 RepID=UPI00262F7102|nr:DUF6146 family protein [Flavobacterium sp.]
MKNLIFILAILLFIIGCSPSKPISDNKEINSKTSDTIKIANKELEYEVIIIDGGFSSWLNSFAKPRGYYSESYMQNRNQIYVTEWNRRVMQPQQYNPTLYEMQINYDFNTKYGYEVNYLIYNYFIYFQITYKQQLAGFVPRP